MIRGILMIFILNYWARSSSLGYEGKQELELKWKPEMEMEMEKEMMEMEKQMTEMQPPTCIVGL